MASGKRKPPSRKPQPRRPQGSPGPRKPPPSRPGIATRSRPLGIAMQWWIVIGVLVVALIVGVVVQSSRSKTENTEVVQPKHQLGPNDSEIEGDSSAPVLVQEYADFQCPSCKRFQQVFASTIRELVDDGKLRFAYTYFPFLGDESVRAASAAVCAGDEDRFFPYADVIYANQGAENSGVYTTEKLVALGRDAGITGPAFDRFAACVRADRYEGFVLEQADNASKRGVNSTPTLFITGPNGNTTEMTPEQLASPAAFEQAVADAADA